MSKIDFKAPDLTLHPPRSPRVSLGGYVLLPRMIDKARATVSGKNGEYHYNCPLDQRFLEFVGIDAEAFLEQVRAGKGDGELLAWVNENSSRKPSPWEIGQWSGWQVNRAPSSVDVREFFTQLHQGAGPAREDITTWADLLDLDDYVAFGGQP